MDSSKRHVVVLGASPKKHRYSNQTVRILKERGYPVTPVHPKAMLIEGIKVLSSVEEIDRPVDTLTLYVGPQHLEPQIDALLALKPGRVIFNPGSESKVFRERLDEAGIPWLETCTLVMLDMDTF